MNPTLPGITAKPISSTRIDTRVLLSGDADATPVLFLHGNASSATFWEDLMVALPKGCRGIAPDQRGYGDADRTKLIDATRGLGDLADDAAALLDALGIEKAHVVGHSLGGSVIWRLLMDYPERILSATVVCPARPMALAAPRDWMARPATLILPALAAGRLIKDLWSAWPRVTAARTIRRRRHTSS